MTPRANGDRTQTTTRERLGSAKQGSSSRLPWLHRYARCTANEPVKQSPPNAGVATRPVRSAPSASNGDQRTTWVAASAGVVASAIANAARNGTPRIHRGYPVRALPGAAPTVSSRGCGVELPCQIGLDRKTRRLRCAPELRGLVAFGEVWRQPAAGDLARRPPQRVL